MDTTDYIEHGELILNDRKFYEKLDAELNPTLISTEEVEQKIDDMFKNNHQAKQKYNFFSWKFTDYKRYIKYLNNFHYYKPIVSGFNFCTRNMSKFVDSSLKFQAQKCKSYMWCVARFGTICTI